MPSIYSLIPDIEKLLEKKGGWDAVLAKQFSNDVAGRLCTHFSRREEDRAPTLRLSQMGPRCPCALWHSIHTPELGEGLPAGAKLKYAYGHLIEALVIALAKAAGHTVTGEQDAVEVDGIVGHRDCIIDGCIVDVKSASSISFAKFKDKSIGTSDTFGYLDQLDGYMVGSLSDPLVQVKDKAYLLVIDKQLGHMVLYEHSLREDHIRNRIRDYKQIIKLPSPPACECRTVPDGKSGNIKLDTKASYSAYKHSCFPRLRTFIYASGPVFLTKVMRRPDVREVDKYGNTVFN